MSLITNGMNAWHWAVGGAAIGIITLTLLYVTNRRLGISTGFENICAIASRLPYFLREEVRGKGSWRFYLLGGLLLGGFLSAVLGGGWEPIWDLGRFDDVIGWGPVGKVAWMFVGGTLIGLGTRTAGGCTSGHGIFGLSNFEAAGWISTVSFMGAGIVATNLIYRVILG